MPRKKRKPFSLLKRGEIYYVRLWDDEAKKYGTARTTKETDRDAALIKADKMIGDGILPARGAPLAVDYIIERIEAGGTSAKYKRNGIAYVDRYIRPGWGKLKLADVKSTHLNQLFDKLLKKGLSGRTVNRIIAYIKPAFKAAFRRGYIPRDPTAAGVDKAPENLKRRGSLTADEIKRIIAMTTDLRDRRFKPYMVIAILTGMRKGELRALRWHDVDLARGVASVRHSFTDENGMTSPKTEDSVRDIPILQPVRDALITLRDDSPYTDGEDFVIYQANRGAPIPSHFVDKAFIAVLDALGIDESERRRRHLVPHSTRHSFVTFSRTLLPDFIVGGLSGHTTTAMIDQYGRPTGEHFRTARDVLNAALTVKPEKDEQVH